MLSEAKRREKKKRLKHIFHENHQAMHRRSEIPCKIYEGVQKFMTSLIFF